MDWVGVGTQADEMEASFNATKKHRSGGYFLVNSDIFADVFELQACRIRHNPAESGARLHYHCPTCDVTSRFPYKEGALNFVRNTSNRIMWDKKNDQHQSFYIFNPKDNISCKVDDVLVTSCPNDSFSIEDIMEYPDMFSFRIYFTNRETPSLVISPIMYGGGAGFSKRKVLPGGDSIEQAPLQSPSLTVKTAEINVAAISSSDDYLTPPIEPRRLSEAIRQDSGGLLDSPRRPSMTNKPKTAVDNEAILDWINFHLSKIDLKAKNMETDLEDGFILMVLIEVVTGNLVSDHRSRLYVDEPIKKSSWIRENNRKIREWLSESVSSEARESILHFSGGSVSDNIAYQVVWALLCINLGRDKMHASKDSMLTTAKEIFAELRIPFLYKYFDTKEKELVILLGASLIRDRILTEQNEGKDIRVKKWTVPPQKYETSKPLDANVVEQGVLRVFMSSTFRDMQAERDRFFQYGAVELKKICKEKGVDLVFIDLRWGLTQHESSDGWVVIRCCESIKSCPYFACHLGSRYGWIPDQSDPNQWHPETNKRFPFLSGLPKLSVTEYEIQCAALADKPFCSRVFFYFRDEEYALANAKTEQEKTMFKAENAETEQKQEMLKFKIKEKYAAFVYRGAVEFSDLLTSHLSFAIEKDFSGRKIHENQEEEAHFQFMQHRLVGFEGRDNLLDQIYSQINDQLDYHDKQIVVLASESGIGKSSLMAATVKKLERLKRKNMSIVYHFVGCTNTSNYVESISVRFWNSTFKSEKQLSKKSKKKGNHEFQKEALHGLMKYIEFKKKGHNFVFLIDAINQLLPSQETASPHLLAWLPKKTPKNVAFVVSTIDTHPSFISIQNGQLDYIPITKLEHKEIKQSIVSYLGRYDKKLSENQIESMISDSDDTGHPLYLRLVLEEIRVYGVFENLNEELKMLLDTNGVLELYNLIISRWQSKFNTQGSPIVDISMKVLYISRIGLSESELDKFLQDTIGVKLIMAEWKSFFFTLIESLFVRNGRYMYFHQLLMQTVQLYFFAESKPRFEAQKEYGMWLVGQYSESEDVTEDVVAEICHQLCSGECYEALVEYLRKEFVVLKMLSGRYKYEFFVYWRTLHEKGFANYKEIYRTMVKSLQDVGDLLVDFFLESYENSFLITIISHRISKRTYGDEKSLDYMKLARVYKNMQNWEESIKWLFKCLDIKIHSDTEEDDELAEIYEEIGFVYYKQNRNIDALLHLQKGHDLRVKLYGDSHLNMTNSFDCFGNVHLSQKLYDDASIFFMKSLEIRLKFLGQDHPLIASSYMNLSKLELANKRFAESLEYNNKALKLLQDSFGETHPTVGAVYSDAGGIYEALGDFSISMEHFKRCVYILSNSVGENHPNVITALEKIGELNHKSKKYVEALSAYSKVLDIRKRTLGANNPDVATALENIGRTNLELKRYDQVLEFLREAVTIRKSTNTQMSLQSFIQIGQLKKMSLEGREYDIVIYLNKRLVTLLEEKYSYNHTGIWISVIEIDEMLKKQEMYHDSMSFWAEMRIIFFDKLGAAHTRTLESCKYLSRYSEKVGKKREPVEFTHATEIIGIALPGATLDSCWNPCEIAAYLLDVVNISKLDESKAESASLAISLLNLMNMSFGGIDLSNIRIPGANLTGSVLEGTNLSEAYLDSVDLTDSIIGRCNFSGANMRHINLGLARKKLEGHTNSIRCLCKVPGPNGRFYIASASGDKTIRVWDVSTGNLVKTLEGHTNAVRSICHVPGPKGENWLASGSEGRIIRLWDLESGVQIHSLQGHTSSVTVVCGISGPGGECWLASGSEGKTIRVWDVATLEQIKTLEGHKSTVFSICKIERITSQCWMASAGRDHTIIIWDLVTDAPVRVLEGHTHFIWCICPVQGPNGEKWLASGSSDETIRLWDIETGNQVMLLEGHTHYIWSICHIRGQNGENWLASGSEGKVVRIWDLETGTQVKLMEGHAGSVKSVCSINGPNQNVYLVSGGGDNSIRIWDVMDSKGFKKYSNVHQEFLCLMAGPSQERWLMSLSDVGTVAIFDIDNKNPVHSFIRNTLCVDNVVDLVVDEEPRRVVASFLCLHDAKRFSELVFKKEDGFKPTDLTESSLSGGDITIDGALGLSTDNKCILYSIGAVSTDEDFIRHCEAYPCTLFQAKRMTECYEYGGVVEQNKEKAAEWAMQASSSTNLT